MKDDPDKEFVLSLLRVGGLQVQPIPESAHRTPDLRVMMPDGDVLEDRRSATAQFVEVTKRDTSLLQGVFTRNLYT
jgi:hypothetical protein